MLTDNTWPFGLITLGILAGAGIVGLFAVAFAIQRTIEASAYRNGRRPGRPEGVERASDMVGPNRIIQGFPGDIEELWTGMPILMWIAVVGVSIWVIVYLILFWNEVI